MRTPFDSLRNSRTLAIGLWIASCALAGAPARASARFDFLFDPARAIDDHQFFLNRVVVDFGVPRPSLEPVLPRLRNLEPDLPVALFLSRASGRPINVIVDMRAGGLPWCDVFQRVHVQPDVLFVGIDRDPGPPYGKAWGYWKKRRGGVRLADGDISGLVGLQVGHRLVGSTPFDLAQARGRGRTVVSYVAEKGGRGKNKGGPQGANTQGNGHGQGKGNGQGKGRGHGKGHGDDNGHGEGKKD
jgi:hypothetical protein